MKTLAKRSLAIILTVFMLFSVMAVGFTSVSAATTFASDDVIYLQTNSQWRSENARFAAYFFNGSENTWVSAEATADDTITYSVKIPAGNWSNVIFCRMSPDYAENEWNTDTITDRVWNQTENLTLDSNYDCFEITDWSTGFWSKYSDKFVYFVNTKGWKQVGSYCRNSSNAGDTWPGKLCTLVDAKNGVYACKPGNYPRVIFNDYQLSGENTVTFDFEEVKGKYIEPKTNKAYDTVEAALKAADSYVETTAPTTESTKPTEEEFPFSISRVYFDNSVVKWEKVFVYGWSNGMGGVHPMTQIKGTDYWYFDMPQPTMVGVTCFLFKDDIDLWKRYSQDITVVNGCDCYKIEGQNYGEDGKSTSKYSWSVYLGDAPEIPGTTDAPAPEQPEFFPACDPSWTTLSKALDSLGIDASFDYRAKIAAANGITDYTGTAAQNTQILEMLKEGSLRNPEYVAPTVTTPAPKEFTLIGNIDGVNVGCEDDHQSNPYIFDKNGEVTVTFEKMSYVYVKTTDQTYWYMFSSYCTDTSGTLYLSSNTVMEKMGVPAGTHKFKVAENADGTLSLSYVTLSTPATTQPTEPSTKPAEIKDLYLVTNENWTKDGARFAVYFYNYSGESAWINMTDSDNDGIFEVKIPEGNWSHIVYTRMNPAYPENDWNTDVITDRVWNQTSDMELDKTVNTLTITGEEFSGEWSYTEVKPNTPATKPTVAPLSKQYSLIGYIDDADVGMGNDWEANPYLFDKKGNVTVTFKKDSYVQVKTADNAEWFAFEGYCDKTTGILKTASDSVNEKMFVPAGTATFTLSENPDGTLTLSYVTVEEKPTEPAPKAKLVVKSTIKAGKTTTAKVENAGGKKATYTTKDTKVVKVDKNTGKITALKKGSATIKAKVGNVTLTKVIKVSSDPKIKNGKKVLANKEKITVSKGKKITLKITGKATAINNKVVLKNAKIGKIKSKNNQAKIIIKTQKKGTSKLTVTVNEAKKYTFTVKVK